MKHRKRKLRILGLIVNDNAIGFYRLYQPLKTLERMGLAEVLLTPTFKWGRTPAGTAVDFPDNKWFETKATVFEPDIIVAERHDFPQYIALLMALRDHLKAPVVVDTDDDIHAVRPYNPGYSSYNPDSDQIGFNIKLMSVVDGITCSTEHLAGLHEKYKKHLFVNPNGIDFASRVFTRKKRKDGKIRIGWLGSACHWENLQIIQQAVKDIVANYPQVEFHYTNLFGDIWANPPSQVRERVVPACYATCKEYHSACNKAYQEFDVYAKYIHKLNLDIGLAPLQDNLFNRSKSNLRVLEYWAGGIAVVASPVRPYSETIVSGENGILAKEPLDWYTAIERLIVDTALLARIKKSGSESLKTWDVEALARPLAEFYRNVIDAYQPSDYREKIAEWMVNNS